ncbi:hypothetical protein PMAYCL1PPCAC_24474, partial [Pristionchus mayeri]
WERCFGDVATGKSGEMVCYAPFKCKYPTSSAKSMMRIKYSDNVGNNGKCDTGIQFKPIGNSKWLVYMQVEEDQLDLAEGVR